jgi:hypothetical protein
MSNLSIVASVGRDANSAARVLDESIDQPYHFLIVNNTSRLAVSTNGLLQKRSHPDVERSISVLERVRGLEG